MQQSKQFFTQRLKFVHFATIALLSTSICAENILKKFNPRVRIQTRGPQSFVADVDFTPAPERKKVWLESVLVEDNGGVLLGVKTSLDTWERQEQYIRDWNLESFGSYEIVTAQRKRSFLNSKILKYADKRLTGELKSAEKGSALAVVGSAQKVLRAESKVSISENYKLKFKARLLQGKAVIRVVNPYVDYVSTVSFSSGLNMKIKKDFKAIRTIASVDYNVGSGLYTAVVDKAITNSVKTRVSSSQSVKQAVFSSNSNSTVQLMYSTPFNY